MPGTRERRMGANERQKDAAAPQKKHAEDRRGSAAGASPDGMEFAHAENRPQASKARFRRGRRQRPALTAGLSRRPVAFVANHALPLFIICSAGLFAFLAPFGSPAAIAVMGFAGVLACLVQSRQRAEGADIAAMRSRFEELEDKAWELSESEERYRTITDAFGDLVAIRDHGNRILSCNAAYAASLGTTPEEIIAGNRLPAMDESGPAQEEATGFPARLVRQGERTELVIDTPDGRKWYHWLDLPVRGGNGGKSAILSVARDITSFKRSTELDAEARKQAEQANRAKSRFLAMASHEMRTPLNGIIGMSKLLGTTPLTPEQHNYTEALRRSGQSLLTLIEGMLDLTTIEAGRFALKPQRFALRAMLEDTLELLHYQAAEKDLGLGLYVAPDVPEEIEADGERLRQVLINLVGNAIKFTQSGGVAVECGIGVAGGRKTLVLRIRDTGPGLSEQNRARIFREFEQVEDNNARSAGGAGLGLAISRALAEQFGGTLELQETGGQGSVFAFTLPLEQSSDTAHRASLEGRRIALVMENPVERDCLSRTLQDMGASVPVSETKLSGCDTVLVDGETAGQVLKTVQAFDHEDRPRVCVSLTAGQKALWPRLRESGADAWLTRPVRQSSLEAVLNSRKAREPAKKSGSQSQVCADDHKPEYLPAAGQKRRILLAEDNDINALLVTAALAKAGHEVIRVGNGAEAVAQCTGQGAGETAYDLVLMDMHMPVMDGIHAIREIRQHEVSRYIPILILSADGVSENRQAALDAGADGFLSKPVDPSELLKRVDRTTASDRSDMAGTA